MIAKVPSVRLQAILNECGVHALVRIKESCQCDFGINDDVAIASNSDHHVRALTLAVGIDHAFLFVKVAAIGHTG